MRGITVCGTLKTLSYPEDIVLALWIEYHQAVIIVFVYGFKLKLQKLSLKSVNAKTKFSVF